MIYETTSSHLIIKLLSVYTQEKLKNCRNISLLLGDTNGFFYFCNIFITENKQVNVQDINFLKYLIVCFYLFNL